MESRSQLLIHETLDLGPVSAATSKGNEKRKPVKCSQSIAAQAPTTSATTGAPTIPQDKPQSRCRAHGTKALEWPQRRHHFSGLVLQEEISD
jgi:hypothetical protein